MTAAERKRLERDRRKAGLVRVELWLPADRADEIGAAIAQMLAESPEVTATR